MADKEGNRLTARAARYVRVGASMGAVAARMAGSRLLGLDERDAANAAALTAALGGLKGPLMKVAQLLSTVPDLLPPEYAAELQTLQSQAPPMSGAFVKRRMQAELGGEWRSAFRSFDLSPAAAASLGQVHRGVTSDGGHVACKLQYPDMESAVEADLKQLRLVFGLHRRMNPVIDTSEIAQEIGERIREELDYRREAKHAALYGDMLRDTLDVRVPKVHGPLSTGRLLTLEWLEGTPLLSHKEAPLEVRNRLATALFHAWWRPFARFGVIHGDPHLGNYTVFAPDGPENAEPMGINLLDYGCVRIFPPAFAAGVLSLYEGLRDGRRDQVVAAYESWGFNGLNDSVIDTLNIWARFIYGPLLDDRKRSLADGTAPGEYGRREAFAVHQALKTHGPVTIPREFVFMDRAAIGLGSVFLHLRAELNFHRLFETEIAHFDRVLMAERQQAALRAAGLN